MDIEVYDFNEHLASIAWLDNLPSGLVHERVDLRYSTVTLTKLADGCQIYIGPKDLDLGGDVIIITLDSKLKLKDYTVERIAPIVR
ncbi:MAG: hypothetical protein ACPG52_02405 [Cognaticolwellia sp.]